VEDAAAVGEGELTMIQDIFGQVSIDERIAANLREGGHHPKTQDETA
jgi:hypothetical protein